MLQEAEWTISCDDAPLRVKLVKVGKGEMELDLVWAETASSPLRCPVRVECWEDGLWRVFGTSEGKDLFEAVEDWIHENVGCVYDGATR